VEMEVATDIVSSFGVLVVGVKCTSGRYESLLHHPPTQHPRPVHDLVTVTNHGFTPTPRPV
jgi:hypothetical protein